MLSSLKKGSNNETLFVKDDCWKNEFTFVHVRNKNRFLLSIIFANHLHHRNFKKEIFLLKQNPLTMAKSSKKAAAGKKGGSKSSGGGRSKKGF